VPAMPRKRGGRTGSASPRFARVRRPLGTPLARSPSAEHAGEAISLTVRQGRRRAACEYRHGLQGCRRRHNPARPGGQHDADPGSCHDYRCRATGLRL
jgi:hypothetical protein